LLICGSQMAALQASVSVSVAIPAFSCHPSDTNRHTGHVAAHKHEATRLTD
jgi:hypothetical protein